MGAEGGIYIYRDEDIRNYPGNGDVSKMLMYIPRHYQQELNGKTYHTFYYGSDMLFYYHPFRLDEEDYEYASLNGVLKEDLERFMAWVESDCPCAAIWEVWT